MASEEPGDVVGLVNRKSLRSRTPPEKSSRSRTPLIQLGGHPDEFPSEDPGEVGVRPPKKRKRRREKDRESRKKKEEKIEC